MSTLNTLLLAIFVVLLTACSDNDNSNTVLKEIEGAERYLVTFTDTWSEDNFPTNFPSSRHFSGLIGATHNEQVVFWEPGQAATPGIKAMAETGAKGALSNEVDLAIASGQSNQIISGGGIGRSPSSVTIEFSVTKEYPLVTLVSMVAPSPDWFVGVNGLDLRDENGQFVSSLSVPLEVYDAGTDSGQRFSSANSASEGEVITRLSCEASDCDFLQGVHRDSTKPVTTIGSFVFERIE